MDRLKIAVYTIAKNERQYVDKFADACSEADGIFVTDTGSTDGTVEAMRRCGIEVSRICLKPWRFDVARNISMAFIPKEFDVCIRVDLDEQLVSGWRQHLESVWTSDVTRIRYKYIWSFTADGSPDMIVQHNAIHRHNYGYHYSHPAHEVLHTTLPEKQVWCGLEIHHHADGLKSRSDYLPLLELAVRENRCPRTLFYLAREFSFRKEWQKCIPLLEEYLSLPSAWWKPERSHALRLLGQAALDRNDAGTAEGWFIRACTEYKLLRDNWLSLAKLYYQQRAWESLLWAATNGLQITSRVGEYPSVYEAWGFALHDFAALACWNLGMYDRGLKYADEALLLAPHDQRLKDNQAFFARKLSDLQAA